MSIFSQGPALVPDQQINQGPAPCVPSPPQAANGILDTSYKSHSVVLGPLNSALLCTRRGCNGGGVGSLGTEDCPGEGGVLLAHGVHYIPTPMGLPDLSHQLQRWPCHLALAGPLMWGQGNLCEVLRTQGQREPSICETLPLPGGTNIKRGYLYGLLPSHGLRPICLVQPGPARPLKAPPTAKK